MVQDFPVEYRWSMLLIPTGIGFNVAADHDVSLSFKLSRCHPSAHPDGSCSKPSRWHQSAVWRSTKAWPLGLDFDSSCGPRGLCLGTAACSLESQSTSGREGLHPCGKLSHCSIPALLSLLNRGAALQTNTTVIFNLFSCVHLLDHIAWRVRCKKKKKSNYKQKKDHTLSS